MVVTITESKDAQVEDEAPAADWRIDLTTAELFRRTRDGHSDDLYVQVPTDRMTQRMRDRALSGYGVFYWNGDPDVDRLMWENDDQVNHPHPIGSFTYFEAWTRPQPEAALDVDHIREVVAFAAYENMWELGRQGAVVSAIMRNYVEPLQNGTEPPTFREAIRKTWNGFAYGVSRERFQTLEDRIRTAVASGWKLDVYARDRDLAISKVATSSGRQDRLRRAFDSCREATYVNVIHASAAISTASNENGYAVDVAQYADLREVIRRHFTLGVTEVPADIAAITDVEQLQKMLAAERAQTEFGLDVLYKHADERGWCSEYDTIMRKAGWPGRPKNWHVSWKVTGHEVIDDQWLRQMVGGGPFEIEGTIKRPWQSTMSVVVRAQEQPDEEKARTTEQQMRDSMTVNYPSVVVEALEYVAVTG